jgi:outer membrane protein assembly factor BamB
LGTTKGGENTKKVILLTILTISVALLTQVAAVEMLELEWAFNTSDVFADKSFGAGHQGCQTVWDVDGDGSMEVVFGTRRGDSRRLWCIDQDGQFEWIYPPLAEDGLAGDPWGVSLVDVDNDGTYELAVAGRGGKLYVLNGDGTEVWIFEHPAGENMLGPPQAMDTDGDGFPEFFMNDASGFIHRVSHEGELIWTSIQAGESNQGHPTLADIDKDDVVEVLWASNDNNLYCIDSTSGAEEWRFDAGANMQTNANFVADVNNDGEYEAVIWTDAPTNAVFVVSFYGTELGRWTEPYGANIRLTPAMGDVDHDGNLDMAFVSGSAIYVIDLATLKTKWEANVTQWAMDGMLPNGSVANHWSNYPLIADIDGDLRLEVLWLLPYPIVTDAATGALESYYLNEHIAVNRRQENGGWWGDVDQDGVSEWVCELNGNSHPETQLYCLTAGGSFPAEAPWPEYVHSAYPAEYQLQQDWLSLRGAYSKGCWFKIGEQEEFPKTEKLEVEWAFNTSEVFDDKSFGAGHQGCQTVWDVDGDGVMEIVFGTRRGDSKRFWCIDQDANFEWVYPPIGEDGLPGDPTSKPSLVDVDNDGVYELALAGRGGRLHVINGDGTVVWTWDDPNEGSNMHGAPQAWDVDGDGFVEFFMQDAAGFIHRVSHEGELVWTSFQAGADNQGHPTIADIDRDDVFEVLWASQDNNLYCIDSTSGAEEWRFDTGANMQTNQVIVADVNNDGEFEAVVWTDAPTNAVFVVSFYGTELGRWTEPNGANIRICQAMGDVNRDGNLDMAVMSGSSVFCIDLATLSLHWTANLTQAADMGIIPSGATPNHWTSYQTIADFDGDGDLEILWLAPYPIVTDAVTGSIEAYYLNEHIAVNRRQENGGWFGDVDQDGVSEWVCELNGNSHPETQLYCLTAGGSFPAESPWPEYYHCAYPAEYQNSQSWLTLKGAYSNSLWFPMPEMFAASIGALLCLGLLRRRR